MAEDAIQGHRLQALLGFQEHYVATTVAAQVIGGSGSDGYPNGAGRRRRNRRCSPRYLDCG